MNITLHFITLLWQPRKLPIFPQLTQPLIYCQQKLFFRPLAQLALLKKAMILLQIEKQYLRTMCVHMAEKIAFQGVKKHGFSEQMKLPSRP
jgi:hypothetical protein